MLIPSETVIVPKMIALPPAASAPAAATRANSSMCMLHGVTMLHVEAIPTMGFLKSSSLNPTARSMERFGARSAPSTTMEENLRVESGLAFMDDCERGLIKPSAAQAGKRLRNRTAIFRVASNWAHLID